MGVVVMVIVGLVVVVMMMMMNYHRCDSASLQDNLRFSLRLGDLLACSKTVEHFWFEILCFVHLSS